jgi:hypothetical protein
MGPAYFANLNLLPVTYVHTPDVQFAKPITSTIAHLWRETAYSAINFYLVVLFASIKLHVFYASQAITYKIYNVCPAPPSINVLFARTTQPAYTVVLGTI